MSEQEKITSRFWGEVSETSDPFTARQYICSGYDVFADLLPQATFIEYLYVLFKGQKPDNSQKLLLDKLAIALANPGPKDHSVRAAMSAAAGGSTAASCLMSALAVGAGNFAGSGEVAAIITQFEKLEKNLKAWQQWIQKFSDTTSQQQAEDVWLPLEHVPGFNPHGCTCPLPVKQTLRELNECGDFPHLRWLQDNRQHLELAADAPLSLNFVAAAALVDLGLNRNSGETLFLLLRLPGAAVHAIEQRERGWRDFPFHGAAITVLNPSDKTTS